MIEFEENVSLPAAVKELAEEKLAMVKGKRASVSAVYGKHGWRRLPFDEIEVEILGKGKANFNGHEFLDIVYHVQVISPPQALLLDGVRQNPDSVYISGHTIEFYQEQVADDAYDFTIANP